jgi:hypothetical protein
MKSALTLIVMVIIFQSCGNNQRECRSREHMRIQCQVENMPTYGRTFSQELCSRSYESDRCY